MPASKLTIGDLAVRLDRLEALLDRIGPVSDPAPDDWGRLPGRFDRWYWNIPIPPRPGDPSPVDLSRFSRVQLELALTQIAAERIRLDALEGVVKEQLKSAGRG
jgi:hypothetical protein